MLQHYFRVYALDKWKFLPTWQKYMFTGFLSLVGAVSIPFPEKHVVLASILLLFGFWCMFAAVFYFFALLFKKDKNPKVEG